LRSHSFGEIWVGGIEPAHYNQLFVSVQTLNNRIDQLELSPDFFDFIIIDEVHHIAADSYRPILHRFTPKILLGLTATPERHDGTDIRDDFCGTIAAELRLPEAINQRYLCPFQYFGINDSVDLSLFTIIKLSFRSKLFFESQHNTHFLSSTMSQCAAWWL
jgi:superfamily II DNA or RNA helicase